jgi:peptidoglycan-associated lipoprotein
VKTASTLVAFSLGLSLAAGCGASIPRASVTLSVPTAKVEIKAEPEPEEAEVPASPTIAVSMDISEACHIAAEKNINPRFRYNHDELLPDDRIVLDTIARCLADGELAGRTVNLVGRTDSRGTDEYNLALGERRASTVADYMTKLGTRSAQLVETTRGSMDATGTTEAGRRNDRRVDIVLYAPKTASRD